MPFWVNLGFVTIYDSILRGSMERTFLMIKPDGVQRNLVGEIIRRFETKGFTLVGLKMMQVSRELAEKHYAVHKERPFFRSLVDFITSSPVVAMVWQGEGVIVSARKIIGATNPLNAEPGTIRGDFGISVGRNLIHGSDGPDTAKDEVSLWFSDAELANWTPAITPWVVE
jgi:nucleoside-diphosphate kinase